MSVARYVLAPCLAMAIMLDGGTLHAIEPPRRSSPDATEQAIPPGAQKKSDHPADEIMVIGQETVPRLRHKLRRLDEAFFKRYNELNDVDDYDMICKRETWVGSQIPRTVCRSRLHRQRLSDSATDMLNENGIMSPVSEAWRSQHYEKVRDNVRRLIATDAKLSEMVVTRAALRRRIALMKTAD